MSKQTISTEIAEHVDKTPIGVLAYVRADRTPVQRTLGAFARLGDDIVFATGRRSAKVANLAERPRASFFVEPAGQEPPKWRSALFTGEVREVTCATKRDAALAAVSARNAYIRERLAQNGGADFAIYRLETREIEWLDRTKGAGYVERILVAEEVPA
jgi:nitroimidazol reductase NimA-like FMN-containing flavoprotein (pyridoxamine 5'-phosphate oxidase superfamily)